MNENAKEVSRSMRLKCRSFIVSTCHFPTACPGWQTFLPVNESIMMNAADKDVAYIIKYVFVENKNGLKTGHHVLVRR